MGVVSENLTKLVAKQVDGPRLVVWYDPKGHYRDVADALALFRTHGRPLRGSFLQLRREIDPLLNDLHPPRLVVYVPGPGRDRTTPSIELEAAGVVVQPGQQPPAATPGSRWSPANALRPIRGDDNAAEVEKQVEAGKLTLADLDAIGEREDSGRPLPHLRHRQPPERAALTLRRLATATTPRIQKKSARGELTDLLQSTVEIDLPAIARCRDAGPVGPPRPPLRPRSFAARSRLVGLGEGRHIAGRT